MKAFIVSFFGILFILLVIAAVCRHGEILIPRGDLAFEIGDEVLAVVDPPAAEELARLFARPEAAETRATDT